MGTSRGMYLQHLTTWSVVLIVFVLTCVGGTPCDPRDCIVSDWGHWTGCSQSCGEDGVTERTRRVLQEAACGGSCDVNTTETAECNRWCCAQDCRFSAWTAWSNFVCSRECDNTTERAHRKKSRDIIEVAKCGGYCSQLVHERQCGHLCCYRDCVESWWMEWGPCVGQCEQKGVQSRTKRIIQESACGGIPCSEATEERQCYVGCCPVHCHVGEWGEWSMCNSTCGNGHLYRSRFVQPPECGGRSCADPNELQIMGCSNYVDIDCVVSAWSSWTDCLLSNGQCGEGTKNRTRRVVTENNCKGQACPSLVQQMNCTGPCCTINCNVTSWTAWSACSTECGEGIREDVLMYQRSVSISEKCCCIREDMSCSRTREITDQPVCGGTPCPGLLETKPCREDAMVNCSLTEWSTWSACSNDCGAGSVFRSRTLLTPAYCGGAPCLQLPLDENKDCTSHRARQDCLLSDWYAWEACIRNCDEGVQIRRRIVEVPQVCGGSACSRTMEVKTCHKKCTQICKQSVCSCRTGYYLSADGVTCYPVMCSLPRVQYCPPTHSFTSCRYPRFECTSYSYGSNCSATCKHYENWELIGSPQYVTCHADGRWSQPQIFCAPANNAPTMLTIDNSQIRESLSAGSIVAYMATEDVDGFDKHTYTIVDDPTNRLSIKEHRILIKVKPDFEDPPTVWNVTIRSTDLHGLYVEDTFEFTIMDRNDPPTLVTLFPDTVLENSLAGTHVGCLTGQDDESGSNLTIILVDSHKNTFEQYEKGSERCLRVAKQSDNRCSHDGGQYCVLNRERRKKLTVTVMATDTGDEPKSAYFDIPIHLINVNDRPVAVSLHPPSVPENIKPDEPVADLMTQDEDNKSQFKYELLGGDTDIFYLSGTQLFSRETFDFEQQQSREFEINVKSTDDGKPPLSIVSTIKFKVGDLNESPYEIQLKSYNGQLHFEDNKPLVREDRKGVGMMGTIFVADVDTNDNLTLSLPQNADGRISIVQQRCIVRQDVNMYCTATVAVSGDFNYEVEPQVNISIRAVDRGGLQTTTHLLIHVEDMNDPPQVGYSFVPSEHPSIWIVNNHADTITDILIDGKSVTNISVPENANHYVTGKLEAVDEDKNDGHEFFLTHSAHRKFIIEDDVLKTYTAANLDYEETKSYEIKILVEDTGTPKLFYEKTFNVNVEDVNEAPSTLSLSNNMVTENSVAGTEVGRLSTVDPDNAREATQTFTYSLINDSHGRFTVDGDIVKVSQSIGQCASAACLLDFESASSVSVEVNVTDSGSPPLSTTNVFQIQVVDTNDPPHTVSLPANTVRENTPAGALIGTLTSVEEDAGQSVSYVLLDNTDLFEMKNGSNLISKSVYDYEEFPSYNITVRATDNGEHPLSVDTTITIEVLNINESPRFSGDVEFQVNENAALYTPIGVLKVGDPDNGDHLVLTVTGTGSVFQVTNADCHEQEATLETVCTGNLVLNEPLDYANWPEYTVTVTAQDRGGLTVTQDILIRVTDDNNPPTNLLINGHAAFEIQVKENQQDISIGTLKAVDADEGQSFTYSIVSTDTGPFEIIEDQLKVVAGASLDYESVEEYTLEITVTDNGVPPQNLTKMVSIQIEDVNEAPSNLSITSTQIVENSDEGVVVGQFQVEDPDNAKLPTQTATFTLVDNADGRFMIKGKELQVAKPNGGCLQLGGDNCYLNFESEPLLHVSVLVTDTGVPSRSHQFEIDIDVLDDNDSPRNIQISNYKVEALALAGEVVGTLTADDEDDNQSLAYSLIDDNNGLFAVSDIGLVTKATDDELDISKLYVISASATDNGTSHMQTEELFTIIAVMKDITKMTLNMTSEGSEENFVDGWPVVPENSPDDTVVGTLVATDQRPDQTLTVQITSQQMALKLDPTTNCANKDGGTECKVKVLTAVELDCESTPVVAIIGQVSDGHNQSYTHKFTLSVQNVNEPPEGLRFDGDGIVVQENLKGEVFELFIAQDPDREDVLSFSLTDDGDGRFTITKDGHLATAPDADIDFEETPRINITVAVQDAGGLGTHKVFTVDISDVNEHPGSITLTSNTVEEMASSGTHVGTLEAMDSDEGQTLAYKLLTDADGRFWIDGNVLKVKDEGVLCTDKGGTYCLLDYESETSHAIVVEVSDDGSPVLRTSAVMNVLVSDVNDPPRDLTLTLVNVREDTDIGQVIGKLKAVDDDADASLHYTILSGNDDGVFSVHATEIQLQKQLDYETSPKYSLTIQAEDNGQPPLTVFGIFSLSIVDANEAPGVPSFQPTTDANHDFPSNRPVVDENAALNTVIGQIVVQDPDDNDMIMFTTTNTDVGFFHQDCWALKKGVHCTCDVRTLVTFDYETKHSVDVYITVTDRQGSASSSMVTLNIADINDPPTDILMNNQSLTTLSIAENSKDAILASMNAVDVDAEDTHTYSILTRTNAFFVVGDDIKVSPQGLDYELYPTHDLVIRVTDNGDPPLYMDKHITVEVIDVNEAPEHIFLSKNEVPENSDVGFEVGTVIVDDPDNVRSHTQTFIYSLKDSGGERFRLDGDSLTVARSDFDFEKKRMYVLSILVTDTGIPPLSAEASVNVYITDANDAPEDLQLTGGIVAENSELGTFVGRFLATDDDFNQHITYSLLSNDFFTIAGDELMVDGDIDYERSTEITLGVIASDDGSPPASISINVTVRVIDVNETPVNITLQVSDKVQGMMIPEALEPGDRIGSILVTDPDHHDRIKLQLIGDSAAMFKVSQNPLCKHTPMKYLNTECEFDLVLAQPINYEDNNSNITVDVEASDMLGETLQITWEFGVKNSNEPPLDISIDGDIKAIPENSPNFFIGSLNTEDEDVGDEFVYHILTHWEIFRIISNRLFAIIPLNHEAEPSVTVSIKSMDTGSPPMSFVKEFTFDVGDKNEVPTDIVLSHSEVSNAAPPGDVVGFITVTDPDNQGAANPVQVHTCTVGGDALGFFTVEPSTPLALKVSKDLPKDVFEMLLRLTCEDDGNPVLSLTVDITLTINETVAIQKGLRLRNQLTIPENSDTHFVVGELEVVNMLTEEAIDGTYTYTLSNEQLPFVTNGASLETSKSLDFERQSEWEIDIVTSGVDIQNKDVNITETFVITVEDINEAPYKINIYGGGLVLENSAPGTEIGDLNSEDHDGDQTYNYTIIAVSPGLDMSQARHELKDTFTLQGKTLIVGGNSEELNYEVVKYFTLVIQTTDSGNTPLSYNDTIHIQVQDANDVPTDILLTQNTIPENSDVGTVVGELDLVDEDALLSFTCVVINSKSVPFKVDNDSILVTSRAELDYESTRVFTVEIQCTDEGKDNTHLKISKAFVVNVTNINEPPIRIEMTNTEVEENNQEGQVIGEIRTTDPDSNKVKLTLVGSGESPSFSVDGDSTIVASKVLDFEEQAEYSITIRATDEEGLWSEETFKIEVQDKNEPPTAVVLDRKSVDENTGPDHTIGTLTTLDGDHGQTFIYVIVDDPTQTAHGYFKIEGDTLVTGPTPLDHEMQSEYTIGIKSTDNGNPAYSVETQINIKVENINEEPEDIIVGALLTLPENAISPAVVTSVEVDDPDIGQHHICQVEPSSLPFSIKTSSDDRMELVLNGALDFETKEKYDVVLRCSDGVLERKKSLPVLVSDVNERPESIHLSGTESIVASAPPGSVVGNFSVQDPDTHQTHTLTLTGPNSDLFRIEGSIITLAVPIPDDIVYAEHPVITINVTATDNGMPKPLSVQQIFTIVITNVQVVVQQLPVITLRKVEILEDSTPGKIVGSLLNANVSTDDIDFKIILNPFEAFKISKNKSLILDQTLTGVEGDSIKVTIEVKNKETFKSASTDIVIFIIRVDKCRGQNNKTCDEHARCVQLNDTSYDCECETGYTGDGFDCTRDTYCDVNPCNNDGRCVDGIDAATCFCKDGYSGPLCEVSNDKNNPCFKGPCKQGGICSLNDKIPVGYDCECEPGWKGTTCEESVDDCISSLCYGGGQCVDKHMTYICQCPQLRTGTRCEYFQSSCATASCGSDICVPMVDRDESTCASKESEMVHLQVRKSQGKFDKEAFNAWLIDKITAFYRRSASGSVQKPRVRRQTVTETPVQVYIVNVQEVQAGLVEVDFVVLDSSEEMYEEKEVLAMLSNTCDELSKDQNDETVLCPAVSRAMTSDQGKVMDDTGPPVAIIAGAVAGVVVLVCVVVAIVIYRKRKRQGDNSDKDTLK